MDFCEAIASRKLVEFNYDGHSRVVIPAAQGRQATTGNLVLRGYQIGGTGNTRAVPFWDLFLMSKIVSPRLTGGTFAENPPGYKRNDAHISPIGCQL
jgi:hypothetical protein